MSTAYRSSPKDVPLTDNELAFWEKIYVAVANLESSNGDAARSWADKAVLARRERFGVR
jgi:hypothetical protein